MRKVFVSYVIKNSVSFGSFVAHVHPALRVDGLMTAVQKAADQEAAKYSGKPEEVVLLCVSRLED